MDLKSQIISRIQTLLATSDLEIMSERSIRETLQQELGASMVPYKEFIHDEVKRFLESAAVHPADAALPPAPAPQPAAQTAAAPAAGSKRKLESPEQGQAGGTTFPLSETKRVEVQIFQGNLQIDIRERYKDKKTGELKPGQKGLALMAEQWGKLAAEAPAIDTALGARDTSYALELSHNRRVTISEFKSDLRIDLREYYEKGGQLMPGKKGVSLQQAEWQELRRDGGGAVQAAVDALLPHSAAAGGAGPPAAQQPRTAAAQQSPAHAQDQFAVSLSSNRRVLVSTYKGKLQVDLRETYEKDGQTLPGKKGIALSVDQFQSLKGVATELTAALQSGDESYKHALGDKRKASIQKWKNVPRVSVREFYVKKGETDERPGMKGLDMPAVEWSALCNNMDAINAEAERLLTNPVAR